MPKKPAARTSFKASLISRLEVGTDGSIPSEFIYYLAYLSPTNEIEASSDAQQPPKRRKVAAELFSPICVAKGRILFNRRPQEREYAKFAASCKDAGQYLKFTLQQHNKLVVSSRPGAPPGFSPTCFFLNPDEVEGKAAKILQIAGSNTRRDSPGDIWASVRTMLTCQGQLVTLSLSFELHWNETPSPYFPLPNSNARKTTNLLINCFWPSTEDEVESAWSPMHFYEAAHVPPKNDKPLEIVVPGLESTLFPYQNRTLQWLLAREGVHWCQAESRLQSLTPKSHSTSVESFRTVQDADGNEVFVSDVFQTITRDTSLYQQADESVKGGILAEEMGLGKTLEVLGLILLHSRLNIRRQENGQNTDSLVPTGATLIVTPESLRQQWITEISRHAPSLRVKHYQGCKKVRDGEEKTIISELCGYDVVITTYSVLSAELHFALEPPQRSRRYERAYHRITSPLVKISWWRLCLDEAQMIENGYSQAASVARVLPRINAWGITGTPVKNDVQDLFGLLLFLGYQPYSSTPQAWQALITKHKRLFQQIFNSIALRHTKSLVRDEISLPAQKRFTISMPFTAVEQQHYQSLFKEMADECGLEIDGSPKVDDWDPQEYEDTMRIWLNRLRQTTLHPEVGVYSRRLLGYNKARPMRTVDEVLTAMLEQSENAIRNEERAYLLNRLTRGQLYENSPRVKEALTLWEDVRRETERLVSDARSKLEDAIREHGGEEAIILAEKADHDHGLSGTDDDDEQETKGKIGDCRRRLRSALELHHRAVFSCANAYFQIKENEEMTAPESEEFQRLKKLEDDGYNTAKVLRREILRESNRKATRLMKKIFRKASTQTFVEIPELFFANPQKGIESGRIVDNLKVLYEELNEQANVVDEWREEVVQLLLRPLVDEDDEVETTGEELGDSAKYQDLLMAYVTTLRAAIADRQDAISGQTNELSKHETETSLRLAKAGDGPAPEKMVEMLQKRAEIKPKMTHLSMRAAISEFRGLQSRLSRDAASGSREALEAKIASDQLKATQTLISEQNKVALALETEIESFKVAMNARLEYYRQLQAVSDSVLPLEGPKTGAAISKLEHTEDELRKKLHAAEAKHRYLLNLKETGSKSKEPRMCVICQMPFVIGVLTVCGHQFCKECITLWFKAHHNCPVCKRGLKPSNLHDISIKSQQLQVHSEGTSDQGQAVQRRTPNSRKKTAIYSEFNADKITEIQDIELDGPSFTTKVDTLVRHLLWLRDSDPGAKSIVFSQYKDFLVILRNAFRWFRIGHTSIDDVNGITNFKEDPAVEVFLLHARAHSSGLNLVNASHVFLCEPLLNTALELQAIARVDRIGQQHETTVWLYLVSGTVEEAIYNLSVQRRMEHMGRRNADKAKAKEAATPELLDASIEEANTLELEHAALSKLMSKDRTAGEMIERRDLWECLFGNAASVENMGEGHRDGRLQEKAVMSYLAGEAAEARRS